MSLKNVLHAQSKLLYLVGIVCAYKGDRIYFNCVELELL